MSFWSGWRQGSPFALIFRLNGWYFSCWPLCKYRRCKADFRLNMKITLVSITGKNRIYGQFSEIFFDVWEQINPSTRYVNPKSKMRKRHQIRSKLTLGLARCRFFCNFFKKDNFRWTFGRRISGKRPVSLLSCDFERWQF